MEALDSKLKNSRVLLTTGILLFTFFLIFILLFLKVNRDVIYPNIIVQGINVGNLNKEQAKNLLKENFDHVLGEKRIAFTYKDERWEFAYDEFESRYEYDKAIQEAFEFGKDANLLRRMKAYIGLIFNGKEFPLTISIEDELLQHILEEIGESIYRPSIDAQIKHVSGGFEITPEVCGERLQRDRANRWIRQALEAGREGNMELPVEMISPRITEEILNSIDSALASFSTSYNPNAKERAENLKIASSMINGVVLLPGDVFSTYEFIGPITEANGYKNAPVIVDGDLEPGIGGGVCQIATTLFNAAVRADLEIVERRHHSLPVGYVPLGHDATIAGDWIDFKFKNNKDYPLYIKMYLNGDRVVANIFGNHQDADKEIGLETEIISKIVPSIKYRKDPSKYTDYKKIERQARTGYKVNVYKIIYENGVETHRELLHYDYYRPVDGIIVVGTKDRRE